MSCCGGNCGCGADCKCGNGCGGCKMYPDLSYAEKTTTETLVMGVAPEKAYFEAGAEMGVAGAENGCKCGDNCTCNPCNSSSFFAFSELNYDVDDDQNDFLMDGTEVG
ncbi:hypothetical protein Tsubulata_014894 [Turnera subulata]|uniref:Metallothionein-like protein n=1 Tax=Turnera subulata TaxID=218843 RepID=A0A9Q0G5C3_9ROSI|nr:hypothetical protein Tsubulata_014894 [Turnera subulata]